MKSTEQREQVVELGVIGVDSAKLMIVDPGYLQQFDCREPDIVSLVIRGNRWRGKETGIEFALSRADQPIEALNGLSFNEAYARGLVEQVYPEDRSRTFSLVGAHETANLTPERGGTLHSPSGAALAAVFSTGGDGGFPVRAIYDGQGELLRVEVLVGQRS